MLQKKGGRKASFAPTGNLALRGSSSGWKFHLLPPTHMHIKKVGWGAKGGGGANFLRPSVCLTSPIPLPPPLPPFDGEGEKKRHRLGKGGREEGLSGKFSHLFFSTSPSSSSPPSPPHTSSHKVRWRRR